MNSHLNSEPVQMQVFRVVRPLVQGEEPSQQEEVSPEVSVAAFKVVWAGLVQQHVTNAEDPTITLVIARRKL